MPGRVSSEPVQSLPPANILVTKEPVSIAPPSRPSSRPPSRPSSRPSSRPPSRPPTPPPLVNGVEFDNHPTPETTAAAIIRSSQNPMLPPPSTTPRAQQVAQPKCPSPTIPPPESTPPVTPKPQNTHVNGHEPSTPPATVTSRYSPVSKITTFFRLYFVRFSCCETRQKLVQYYYKNPCG